MNFKTKEKKRGLELINRGFFDGDTGGGKFMAGNILSCFKTVY